MTDDGHPQQPAPRRVRIAAAALIVVLVVGGEPSGADMQTRPGIWSHKYFYSRERGNGWSPTAAAVADSCG